MEDLLKQALSAPRGSVAQNEAAKLVAEKIESLEERLTAFETYFGDRD